MRQRTGKFMLALCLCSVTLCVIGFSLAWSARLLDNEEMLRVSGGANRPPVADAYPNALITVGVGDSVLFSADGSSDPDGDTLSYHWAFGDSTSDTHSVVNHSYASPSLQYNAVLTVTDPYGLSDTDSCQIRVISVVISTPTDNQKIVLPSIPVQGTALPTGIGASISWKTNIPGPSGTAYTTTTQSGQAGSISVSPFPQSNSDFGWNLITATLSHQGGSDVDSSSVRYFFSSAGNESPVPLDPNWVYYYKNTRSSQLIYASSLSEPARTEVMGPPGHYILSSKVGNLANWGWSQDGFSYLNFFAAADNVEAWQRTIYSHYIAASSGQEYKASTNDPDGDGIDSGYEVQLNGLLPSGVPHTSTDKYDTYTNDSYPEDWEYLANKLGKSQMGNYSSQDWAYPGLQWQ